MKKNIFRSKILAFVMAMTSSATAFAADATASNDVPAEAGVSDYGIMPLDGVEDWKYGTNHMSPFTFTNTNTTPTKTILGTNVKIAGVACKAPGDAGIGNVILTIRLKDENGNFLPFIYTKELSSAFSSFETPKWDLEGYGKKIHVWFDASSAGASNGHYRSIQLTSFRGIVGG